MREWIEILENLQRESIFNVKDPSFSDANVVLLRTSHSNSSSIPLQGPCMFLSEHFNITKHKLIVYSSLELFSKLQRLN